MKAAWAKRRSLSRRRKGSTPIVALANVLVAIQLRTASSFRVIAVPDAHGVEPHGGSDLVHSLLVPLGSDEVVAGNVGMAGIEADADRGVSAQQSHQLGYLLKTAAE